AFRQVAADEAASPGHQNRTARPSLRARLRAQRGHRAGNLLRMRLLVCVPWFAPARAFGGTVTVAVATAAGAVEAGHEVTVATTDVLDLHSRVPADAPDEPEGTRVIRFPNVSQRLAATNVPLPRGLRRWLAAHVREFDAVLLLDVYSAPSVLAARRPSLDRADGCLPRSAASDQANRRAARRIRARARRAARGTTGSDWSPKCPRRSTARTGGSARPSRGGGVPGVDPRGGQGV